MAGQPQDIPIAATTDVASPPENDAPVQEMAEEAGGGRSHVRCVGR